MPNSFQLQPIDLILVIGISQGLFLSFSLLRITNNNRNANNILSFLLLIATFMLIGRFVFFRFFSKLIFQWSLWVDSIIFLFGPLHYTYVRRLLFSKNSRYRLPILHFLPFFGILLLSLFFVAFYSPKDYFLLSKGSGLKIIFRLIVISGIVSNTYYLIRSFLLLKSFKNLEKDSLSFNQSPINYLSFFLISISIFVFAWTFSFINSAFFNRYFSFIGYNSIWTVIPIFIYVIGYFSLKQPELFRLPLKQKTNEKKDRLTKEEASVLKGKLDSIMVNEKVFLQSNLTLIDVASILQTSTNNISWLLNNTYNTTFYDYINSHRIKEFVDKIENKEHLQHTILALSMDVGFNSKSTFNKAFKTTMKNTPSNFIKTLPTG